MVLIQVRCNAPPGRLDPRRSVEIYHLKTTRRATGVSGKDIMKGNVWHEPLPLELSREREPYVQLLSAALSAANIATMPGDWGVAARVLTAPKASLVVVVNERPEDTTRNVVVEGKTLEIPVKAWATRMATIERGTSKVLAVTPGDPLR